jgi:hypothetical protein
MKKQSYMFECGEELPLFSDTPQRGCDGILRINRQTSVRQMKLEACAVTPDKLKPAEDRFVVVWIKRGLRRIDGNFFPKAIILSEGAPTSTGKDVRYHCIFLTRVGLPHSDHHGRVYQSEIAGIDTVVNGETLNHYRQYTH